MIYQKTGTAYIVQQPNKLLEEILDLPVWFFLQAWYWPYYVIGKQDQWREWMPVSLNGIKSFNICRP